MFVGSTRAAIGKMTAGITYSAFLAAVGDMFENCSRPEDFRITSDKGFAVFEDLLTADPPPKTARPITITRETKTILASLFASIVSVSNELGKPPPGVGVKTHIVNSDAGCREQVAFMINVAEALWDKISSGRLEYEFDSVCVVRTKLEALITCRGATPNPDELARIYVNFLKCVAWGAANFSAETKVTLNEKFLRGLLRSFDGLAGVQYSEGLSEFFDSQVAWVAENDSPPSKKSGASKKTAVPVAPAPVAPATVVPVAAVAPAADVPATPAPPATPAADVPVTPAADVPATPAADVPVTPVADVPATPAPADDADADYDALMAGL